MEGRGRQSAVCDVSLIKLCRAAPRLCALDLTGVGVGGLWAGSLGPAEALALSPAQALRCHVCSSSSNCKKPQVCSASSSFCKTVIRGE